MGFHHGENQLLSAATGGWMMLFFRIDIRDMVGSTVKKSVKMSFCHVIGRNLLTKCGGGNEKRA